MRDLGNIEVVEGKCDDCMFYDCNYVSSICDAFFKALVGESCDYCGGYLIIKKKEKWATCTRENTKAGDIVRYKASDRYRTVDYVFKRRDRLLLTSDDRTMNENSARMGDYEIQVKE
jgi:hypothetical protein